MSVIFRMRKLRLCIY